MIRLRDLLRAGARDQVRPGVWVEARPLPPCFWYRIKDAWEVLAGRADALTWPHRDDPSSWCAVGREVKGMGQEGTVIMRWRVAKQGGYYHVSCFTARRPETTFAKNGDLCFDEQEWPAVYSMATSAGIEVLVQESAHG